MTDDLERYLQTEHVREKASIEELQRLVDEMLDLLATSFLPSAGTWPYQLVSGEDPQTPETASFSTTAMIAFALALATGRIQQSSLAPAVGDPRGSDELRERVGVAVDRSMTELMQLSQPRLPTPLLERRKRDKFPRPTPAPALTDSATFGWDDPFTLSWLLEVLQGATNATHLSFRRKLQTRALRRVQLVASNPESPILQIPQGQEVAHAFPLLRVLQLAHTIARLDHVDIAVVADLSRVRSYLLEGLHVELSESHIADGGFDAANLVFSLEGWMLTLPVDPDLSVVDEVFHVLRQSQERTPYWRPLRPFKATQQGLVLLPQSVEIANSLLRICNSRALASREYFSRHLDLLDHYTRWLQGRVFRGQLRDGSSFVGWESEHTYTENRIHLWQTSQVLIFLHHYTALLQQHGARKLLRLAPLLPRPSPSEPERPAEPLVEWAAASANEPLGSPSVDIHYRVYARVATEFVSPRASPPTREAAVSMLLYGPPGTGKTTIATRLAKALRFPLLTVTPSDFLTSGGEAVEARAKAIFRVLEEQRDMVVLFDEIDHLLLDRDSLLYREQGDVFKLLTPGMLTKLNDLARQRRVIFVIATNYYERIDRAIKRPGRIDARYLVLPPDLWQRRRYLAKIVSGWTDLTRAQQRTVARRTVLFTYRELDDLAGRVAARRVDDIGLSLDIALGSTIDETPPMIKLGAYAGRLGLDWSDSGLERTKVGTVEQPWEEVALLAYLVHESGGWPSDPPWLADAVKDALKQHLIRDPHIADALVKAVARERGVKFVEDIQ